MNNMRLNHKLLLIEFWFRRNERLQLLYSRTKYIFHEFNIQNENQNRIGQNY